MCAFVLTIIVFLPACTWANPDPPQALAIEGTPRFTLAGRDARRQLVVTGRDASGKTRDLTQSVGYQTKPEGIVHVDAAGLVTPLKEGQAVIVAGVPAGPAAEVAVTVTHLLHDLPINFANQVAPIFTKFGCNGGGCHGKASGQNGFKLSLLGFEPEEDYEYIVKENRGRRLLPSSPGQSMLVLKATGAMAHGGGKRIDSASAYHDLLVRWIEQGTPYGHPGDPTVVRIEVSPSERVLERNSRQQLAVVAHLSDGTNVDVTRLTQFDVNETELAKVSATGLVEAQSAPGSFAVMARYQTHVGVFRALVPLGAPVADLPPAANFVDEHVFRRLTKMGLPPSATCDDGIFVRRVTIDIAGRLPTLEETQQFLADKDSRRHEKLVDRLLASADYADYFASKWSAVLRNRRHTPKDDPKPSLAFHGWIRDSLDRNVPFDQFVRALVTATGEADKTAPAVWYRDVSDLPAHMEDMAQLFLGQRIGCAKCHHHPLEKWGQQDYWGLAAFFSRVEIKAPKAEKKDKKSGKVDPGNPLTVLHKPGRAEAVNPRTKQAVAPTALAAAPLQLAGEEDPRGRLADWLADADNPYFARALVNRYWKHFFGRGLVEPEDDLRATNPPTNPELLDALARHFVEHKHDLKDLVRLLCTSQAYRFSALPNDHNAGDKQSYSRFLPRRLHAEVLFDAIDAVTLSRPAFKGVPAGTRAVQLFDNQVDSYFLSVFGRPDAASACECERSSDSSLAQSLHLFNSVELSQKVAGPRLRELTEDKRPAEERLRDLYLLALSRPPTSSEMRTMLAYVQARAANPRGAYEDILWALLGTKEFQFNH